MNTSVYAQPVMPRIVLRPAVATLALHALMIYLLTVNFNWGERDEVRIKPTPVAINARLVDISEITKPKPKAPPPKKVTKPKKVMPAPRVTPKPKPKPKPQPVAKNPAQSYPAPQKAQPKPEPQSEPRMSADQLAALARAELDDAIAAEQVATADEMAASFAALIRQTVIGYWSRPPSARNGMEALLQVQLVPTGEVVHVSVLKSSGDSAFDRSALNAVEKAGAFPELQKLPNNEFERTFRRLRLFFRPEDLRY